MRTAAIAILTLTLAGCASPYIGQPQTREKFVADMRDGGMFRNSEHFTVNRPLKTVVAETREYASKCLDVRVTRKLPREAVSSTTYRPQVTPVPDGATSLVVQEMYGDKEAGGMPPGGLFVFVAEMRAQGNTTAVDAYYVTGRGKILDALKQWTEGRKGGCPAFT